jgi:GNAT superfamily N-acetyltransferase
MLELAMADHPGYLLRALTPEAQGFAELLTESRCQGFSMLQRLSDEWASGVNRFDRQGEILFGVFDAGRVVGTGGRNIDPFQDDGETGRIRHLYVAENLRKTGMGRLLIANICADAGRYFTRLHLRAPESAFGFYERLGFARITGIDTATHHLML